MIKSLTVVYYTPNYEDETFFEKIRQRLLTTIGNTPLISVSQKPLKFGQNICVGDIGRAYSNVYRQILAGAKEAKTDYVGMAEDDTLYPPDHFDEHYLPPLDAFGYNMSRWSIPTWVKQPIYVMTNRLCNSNMVAPRKLLIELIEKRILINNNQGKLWSEPGKHDEQYGLGKYKIHQYMTTPVVSFIHKETLAFSFLGERKRLNPMRALDIPYWGHIKEMMKIYDNN